MLAACNYAPGTSTNIQIRNVPEHVHREIKARSARAGMTLSEFLLQEIEKILERPSRSEILARLATRPTRVLDPDPTAMLRAERDRR